MRIGNFTAYSQNFLKSKKLVNRLIKKSNITKDDLIIEIGCGKGIITHYLSLYSNKVIGIEVDVELYDILKKKFKDYGNVSIVNKNFLDFYLPKSKYKIFSNIPFNCTSRILKKLYLSNENSPGISYLSLQKEAYYKYSGKKRETQISLLLKPCYLFNVIHTFNKSNFNPQPSVDVLWVEIKQKINPLMTKKDYKSYKDL